MQVRQLTHTVCGHVWTPTAERPQNCPGCRRPLRWPHDLEAGRLVESHTECKDKI